MRRLLRDPFLWGSLAFIAAFPAFDFYVLETNYYHSGVFFGLSMLSLLLVALWLIWLFVCIFIASTRWSKRGWSGTVCLGAAVLVFPITFALGNSLPWQYYNFHKFYQERLEYARPAGDKPGLCKTGTGTAGDPPSPHLSLDQTRPESFATAAGTYVLFPIFLGIPDGFTGFLYAPSLDDPIPALPALNLEFAQLWDREACIFLVGSG